MTLEQLPPRQKKELQRLLLEITQPYVQMLSSLYAVVSPAWTVDPRSSEPPKIVYPDWVEKQAHEISQQLHLACALAIDDYMKAHQ